MRTVLAVMPAFMRVSLATMFQYRAEIVLWAVWGVVYPAVALAMWGAAVAGTGGTDIKGFAPSDFAAYFLLTMVIGHLGTAWDVYEMGYMVRSGRMSTRLLRPLLPIWSSVADNVAYKLLTLTILIPVWMIVVWVTRPTFNIGWAQLVYGLPAVLLASVLSYLWGYILALVAFWTTKTEGVGEVWFGMSLFFGGRLAPLTIMPPILQWIAAFLPAKWIVWFPAAALMGRLSIPEMTWGLLMQAFWLVGGLVVFRFTWRAAVKRYTAVGI